MMWPKVCGRLLKSRREALCGGLSRRHLGSIPANPTPHKSKHGHGGGVWLERSVREEISNREQQMFNFGADWDILTWRGVGVVLDPANCRFWHVCVSFQPQSSCLVST